MCSSDLGLSKEDVDRMVRDAESHAAEDTARRETIEARNQADALAHQVEKSVAENRDRLPAGVAAEADEALGALRRAAAGDDAGAIRRATEALQKVSHEIAERLYQAKAADASQPGPSNAPADDGIVDAEVVEK